MEIIFTETVRNVAITLSAFIAALSLYISWRTSKQNREIAASSAENQLRAWLHLSDPEIVFSNFAPYNFNVKFKLKNFGKTPAIKILGSIDYIVKGPQRTDSWENKLIIIDSPDDYLSLGVDESTTITLRNALNSDDINNIEKGELNVDFRLMIEYTDIFGKRIDFVTHILTNITTLFHASNDHKKYIPLSGQVMKPKGRNFYTVHDDFLIMKQMKLPITQKIKRYIRKLVNK